MAVIGEFSAVVRRAFAERGWDAWSCDLLPSEIPGQHHQGDGIVFARSRHWGLMIAHPPCTYLCNSGVRWLAPGGKLNPERHRLMMKAADFFAELYWSEADGVAVENPVMHGYAADYLASAWKVPRFSQSIQPWQFGHGEVKRTCLWLRGLPPLVPTDVVAGRVARVHRMPPGADRWKERSRTLPGIAKAMAEQWTI
jgi:hypothetical protein